MDDNFINPRRFYLGLTAVVIFIAVLVLVGWQLHIQSLKSILPQFIAMNPITAVLFILSGIALFFIQEKNSPTYKNIAKGFGVVIMLISILALGNVIKVFSFGVDEILYASELHGNKMASGTTFCFLVVGFSFLLIDNYRNNKYNLSQILALIPLIIGLIAVIGYIYGSRSFYGLTFYISMAFHTAFCFCALAAAIMLARYKTGFVSVVMHKNIGGKLIRKLLIWSIVTPIILNGLRLEGDKFHLYDPGLGSAFSGILMVIIFSILLWKISVSLNKTDVERKRLLSNLYQAKDELVANEILYRNLIENSGVVIYTTSIDGLITFANSKSFQLTGYHIEELKGRRFTDFINVDCLQMVKERYKLQIKDKVEETHLEFCINTKNGNVKWVEQSAVLLTENNVPVGFQCIVKDISERKELETIVKKYEVELIQNQELLQSILDNAASLIYVKDLEGKYLLINKEFREKLNLHNNEVIGKTDFDFSKASLAQRFKDTDDEVIRTCKAVELEETIDLPGGKHTLLIVKFPLLDFQNKIYGISGIATDITERAKYREQLIEARKIAEGAKVMQEQFLANMSHEIRTPMNGIQGMNDLLLETELNSEQKDYAKTIKRSADSLLVILNDILDFSKIQAGKLTIEKIDFNVKEVLNNVQALFRHQLKEKKLTWELSVKENVPVTLNGDPYRLNQILLNLIGNAVKFTHQGGISMNVFVKHQTPEEIVLSFTVTDTGIGIKDDVINNIFESFTQASNNTTRKYGGTGLGLAITKQLLEMQQGNISVKSEINIGTTFTFSIPYNYSETNISLMLPGIDVSNYHSIFKGKKFLVAEDNEVNQKVMKRVLQRAGGIVDIVNNGLEAIENLNKNKDYSLIIMDLQMPEMDGYAATKYIRNVMKLSLPIVAMTASALKNEKEKCIAIGMNEHLSKPFNISYLYQRLSLLLHGKSEIISEKVLVKNTDVGLFDLSLLEEMEDDEYLTDILDIFLANTPAELKNLKAACLANQFDTIYKLAHKLKSGVGLLQANSLLKNLVKMEENAKANKPDEMLPLCKALEEQYKKVECALRIYLTNKQLDFQKN